MPRLARIVLPNYPHHIVQRGHNRGLVFVETADYQRYVADLRELKEAFDVKVYAYCLMSNHVHLLLAPGDSIAGLSQFMKTLAARATRFRNKLEGLTGTLWESRYRSSLVQSDHYLLACSRYIELNPVRARMVANASEYEWSSYSAHASPEESWIDLDPAFCSLGETPEERSSHYVEFVAQSIPPSELELIKNAIQRGQLTGADRFVDEVEHLTGLRVERRGPGRPKLE